jgi:hypothetical protein
MCMAGYLGFAFTASGTMALCFVIPSALGYMSGRSMNGLMSTLAPSAQQGELQGAVASLTSLARRVYPLREHHARTTRVVRIRSASWYLLHHDAPIARPRRAFGSRRAWSPD